MTFVWDADEVGRAYGETPPPDAPYQRTNGASSDAEPAPERRLYRLGDLAELKSAAEDYVIGGGLLTRGAKVLLAAEAGAGKTTLLHHCAAALASGRPFLGRYRIDRPYRVLCISAELALAELASHGQQLLGTFDGTPATDNLLFWPETGLRLPRCYAELREVVREARAEIVIFDPFMEFFEGESSDKPEHVQKVFGAVDKLQRDEELAGTIIAHHMRVDKTRSAGSWKFDGWPSTILELERVPGVPNDRMLVFKKIRAPGFGHPAKMQIRLSDAGYLPIAHEEPTRTLGSLTTIQVLREAGGQLRRQELVERIQNVAKVKLRAAAAYVGQAKQEGLIEAAQDGREVVYRLTEATP
ncbi:MAG: AAA family ATPase [Chloroflexota bacterium]|nr:AAA family ATPase [Chloroflexota bacterium]